MTILDKTLLYLLSKADGETPEEKANNFTFIIFLLGVILLLAGLFSLMGASIFYGTILQECLFHCFVTLAILGVVVSILNFLLGDYLIKSIKKHTTVKNSKSKEKEIYKPASEVELSIRALGTEKPISTKETFLNEELNNIKDGCVIIKASKKGEEKTIYAEEVEISLTNKDETAALNVPEEALVYKIEGISLTKETEQKVCGFIKEKETTILRTKIFLSASVDEELLEKLKNKQELDDLLAL
jgi:hypothetical protein